MFFKWIFFFLNRAAWIRWAWDKPGPRTEPTHRRENSQATCMSSWACAAYLLDSEPVSNAMNFEPQAQNEEGSRGCEQGVDDHFDIFTTRLAAVSTLEGLDAAEAIRT